MSGWNKKMRVLRLEKRSNFGDINMLIYFLFQHFSALNIQLDIDLRLTSNCSFFLILFLRTYLLSISLRSSPLSPLPFGPPPVALFSPCFSSFSDTLDTPPPPPSLIISSTSSSSLPHIHLMAVSFTLALSGEQINRGWARPSITLSVISSFSSDMVAHARRDSCMLIDWYLFGNIDVGSFFAEVFFLFSILAVFSSFASAKTFNCDWTEVKLP